MHRSAILGIVLHRTYHEHFFMSDVTSLKIDSRDLPFLQNVEYGQIVIEYLIS